MCCQVKIDFLIFFLYLKMWYLFWGFTIMMTFRCYLSFIIATYLIVTLLYFITSPSRTATEVKITKNDKVSISPAFYSQLLHTYIDPKSAKKALITWQVFWSFGIFAQKKLPVKHWWNWPEVSILSTFTFAFFCTKVLCSAFLYSLCDFLAKECWRKSCP